MQSMSVAQDLLHRDLMFLISSFDQRTVVLGLGEYGQMLFDFALLTHLSPSTRNQS